MFKGRKTRKTENFGDFSVSNTSQLKTKVNKEGRVCTKCNVFKPWEDFSKSKKTVTGHSSSCKDCNKNHIKAVRKPRNTQSDREKSKSYSEHLKKTDPLKKKSQQLRQGMRTRSNEGSFVPTSKELESWLKSIIPFVCYYTGVPLKPTDFSVDHKQPLNRGGGNEIDNLCVCTKQINTTKGNMTENEFRCLLDFLSSWEDNGEMVLRRLRMAGLAFNR